MRCEAQQYCSSFRFFVSFSTYASKFWSIVSLCFQQRNGVELLFKNEPRVSTVHYYDPFSKLERDISVVHISYHKTEAWTFVGLEIIETKTKALESVAIWSQQKPSIARLFSDRVRSPTRVWSCFTPHFAYELRLGYQQNRARIENLSVLVFRDVPFNSLPLPGI